MNIYLKDRRYSIAREHCGYAKPRWVARFCGDWVGQGEHQSDAVMICIAHADKREAAISAFAS